jgi:3-hydroxyisobutyrate dehydrogenase
MAKIAWLGTGNMGAGFVAALRRRGDDVTVWNRTLERARALEKLGAHVAATPNEAVRGADQVHTIVSDDAAIDALLDTIARDVPKDVLVIDHTTVAPRPTVARFARCDAQGIAFLHAPVFMGPQAARESTGVMLCAGPQERFERAEAELRKMTGELWYVGERVDKASALKLLGNELLVFVVAGLADVFGLAKGCALAPADVEELLLRFNPGSAIPARARRIAAGDFAAGFGLDMARKDVRLMLETASQGGQQLSVLRAIAARMDEVVAAGHARDDVSVLAQSSVSAAP